MNLDVLLGAMMKQQPAILEAENKLHPEQPLQNRFYFAKENGVQFESIPEALYCEKYYYTVHLFHRSIVGNVNVQKNMLLSSKKLACYPKRTSELAAI